MLFKAIALDGTFMFFNIGDCPIHIGGNMGALAGISHSSLFFRDTIVRGFESDNGISMFEGDTVESKETGEYIGIVVYNGGFFIHTREGYEKKVKDVGHITVKQGTAQTIDIVCYEMQRSPLEFKYNDSTFQIEHLICKKNGIIVLSNITMPVSEEYIRMFTGLEVDGEKLYYGDFLEHGTVELIEGIPQVIDMASKEVIPLR